MRVKMVRDFEKKKKGTICMVTNSHGRWLIRKGYATYVDDGISEKGAEHTPHKEERPAPEPKKILDLKRFFP